MIRIVVYLLAAILLLLLIGALSAALDRGGVNAVWRSLETGGAGQPFSPDVLGSLPEPARRYLLHAIQPSTPLASSVNLTMSGSFCPAPNAPWRRMRAREVLAAGKGLVWKASIGGFPPMSGYDLYVRGQGRMEWRVLGLLPVLSACGPDISRSAAGRLAAESVWLPSALLPQNGVRWEAIDDHTALALIDLDGQVLRLRLTIAENGALKEAILENRWGNVTEDKRFAECPLVAKVLEEGTFSGYTIPTSITVGWWPDSDRYYEFFRARIDSACFR